MSSTNKQTVIKFQEFLKLNRGTIFLVFSILVLSHMDANAAMLLGLGIGIYAFILLLKVLFLFIHYAVKRAPKGTHSLKEACIRFVCVVILCAISWQGIAYINDKIDRRFQPVIERLEAYKAANGTYPKSLNEIMNHPPQCVGLTVPLSYHRSDSGDSYSILCMTLGFNHHEYFSKSPDHQWKDWD
jgi:hypothetical protein